MIIRTREDAEKFTENIRDIFPFEGNPEFCFVTKQSGQPVAITVFVQKSPERGGDVWKEWRKVIGFGGGVYDPYPVEIDDPAEFVFRYRREISRMLSKPALETVPASEWRVKHMGLVGVSEVGEILGWDRRKVSVYYGRGKLPKPVAVLKSGPVWAKEDIERFKEKEVEKDEK